VVVHRGAKSAAGSIARHRVADVTPDRVADACGAVVEAVDSTQPDRAAPNGPGPGERLEGPTVADRPVQAASRLRPRARRALRTARPPRVRMRPRKP
jgi:hypothetical protein